MTRNRKLAAFALLLAFYVVLADLRWCGVEEATVLSLAEQGLIGLTAFLGGNAWEHHAATRGSVAGGAPVE